MAPTKGGRPLNTLIARNFLKRTDTSKATPIATCIHCQIERSWHTASLERHLKECKLYQEKVEQLTKLSHYGGNNQQVMQLQRVSVFKADQIRKELAMAVYINNRPFTSYQDQWTTSALRNYALNVALLKRKELVGELLEG